MLLAIIETEAQLVADNTIEFLAIEVAFAAVFLVEYVARVGASAEDPKYGPGLVGRLRYMAYPAAVLDLLALAPVLLMAAGSETLLLRLFRLVRVLRLARLGRFSRAMEYIGDAVRSRAPELALSVCVAAGLILISSAALYVGEGDTQPEEFGSIPRAMCNRSGTGAEVGQAAAAAVGSAECQFQGSSSSIRLIGWSAMRARTSRR